MWKLRLFMKRLLLADQLWSWVRIGFVLGVLWLFVQAGRQIFPETGADNSFFSQRSLRFLIAPAAALAATWIAGALYVQDIYELPSFWLGWRYLMAAVFGLGRPRLVVSEGRKQIKEKETNLLDVIGGPGSLVVRPDSVALLTRLTGAARVCPEGVYFVARGESIQEVASLGDQHGVIDAAPATTKDGIEVTVRDIHYQYRLRAGRRSGDHTRRTPARPYPYLVQAVRNMAYGRVVTLDGLTAWHSAVQSAVGGVINDYVSQHQLDHLTAPSWQEKPPRAEIARHLSAPGTRERLKALGAELLWFDIGHFDIQNKDVDQDKDANKNGNKGAGRDGNQEVDRVDVAGQRAATWGAKWLGNAEVVEAYGEAQRLEYLELGRAEAQAEMLMSIINSLEDAVKSGDPQANLRKIVLVRTAQLLDALSETGPEGNQPKPVGSFYIRKNGKGN